jgi:hypothetical protein
VPKSLVIAKDPATGLTYTTSSGVDGAYVVPNLLPGDYEVTITASGLQKSVFFGNASFGRPPELRLNLT